MTVKHQLWAAILSRDQFNRKRITWTAGSSVGMGSETAVSVLVLVLYFWSCFQHCCARYIAKRWTNNV